MKKKTLRGLAVLVAAIMCLCAMPLSALAAPAADIPAEMLENDFLDALAYTGYDVQAQKNDGTLYKKFGGAMAGSSVLSGITYGVSSSGTETVASGSTPTGKAPNIAAFRSGGLVCGSYVAYVYYNYLPNIKGVDTSKYPMPSNLKSAPSWKTATDGWIASGKARSIDFTVNSDGSNFKPAEEIPIGSIIFFTGVNTGGIPHVAIYAGYYDGNHFLTHVGNDRGPEIVTVNGMTKGGQPEAVAKIVVPDIVEKYGSIKVYKKDPNGKNLSGAVFVATSQTDSSKQYIIGPTDNNGTAIVDKIPYDIYTVKETVFPAGHTSSGKSEWTVTVSSANNGVVTINAVNELKKGSFTLKKTSEDGKVADISFRIQGSGYDKTLTTNAKGEISVSGMTPGKYTATELTPNVYEPQQSQTFTVAPGENTVINFRNTLKRGDLKVTKTAEDGLVEGLYFKLSGTSDSGMKVLSFAETDKNGVAVFEDIPITTKNPLMLEEINTPDKYVVPPAQSAVIEWNKVTEKSFNNTLKKFNATVTKADAESSEAQGDATLAGAVYGLYNNGTLVDTYTTDEKGQFTTAWYTCGENWTIREISPSLGYLLDSTVYPVGAAPGNSTVEYNPLSLDVTEQVIKGSISIVKHADNGETQIETPEKGAEFEVYLKSAGSFAAAKETERDRLVCDENGYAESKKFPAGVYVVHQSKGWEGYEFIADFEVHITEDGRVYRYIINNHIIEGNLKVVKSDEAGNPLSGAVFAVYADVDCNGEYDESIDLPVDTLTEADNGVYGLEKLKYGGYFLHEEIAPDGFVPDSGFYYFKILENGETVTVSNHDEGNTFINKPIVGQLEITKTDISDGKPLPGVGFRITNVDTGEVIEGYTDENGMAVFTLRSGRYTYAEFDPLEGYIADTKEYPFEIDTDGQIIKAHMTNEKIPPEPVIPETGDNANLGMIAALTGVAGIAVLLTSKKRRKEKSSS